MPKYTVVQPVEHDHVRVESGEIELTDGEAAPLVAIGAVVGPVDAGEGEPSTGRRGPARAGPASGGIAPAGDDAPVETA